MRLSGRTGHSLVTRRAAREAQVFDKKVKKGGREGGIARGRGRPLVLRFAPDRRVRVVQNRSMVGAQIAVAGIAVWVISPPTLAARQRIPKDGFDRERNCLHASL